MPNRENTQPMTPYVDSDEAQKLLSSIDDMPAKLRRLHRLVKQLMEEREQLLKENGDLQREVNYMKAAARWPELQGEYHGESVDTPADMAAKVKPAAKRRVLWWER